jgi:uncharacterized damage-inducible protein DinB
VTVNADTLRLHLAYTRWATARLLDAAGKLTPEEVERDFGTADKSVVGSLAHNFGADRIWIDRILGTAPKGFLSDEEKSLAFLNADWPKLYDRWDRWAEDLTDESVASVAHYADLKGNQWTTPLWQIILHVVNHGTHHRGQVAGFLRAMGHVPPPLDLIAYYRSL